jgi:DNA-binding XRE family transcriptional regulator
MKYVIRIRLKEYLEQQAISAYTLGKWVTGVSPQTIYAIANGTRKPSLETLEAIICGLHQNGFATKLEDLIQLEEDLIQVEIG